MNRNNFQSNTARLISNRRISAKTFRMGMMAPGIAGKAQPGQFIHLRLRPDTNTPLLRRPFSINDIKDDRIYVLYEIKGTGTEMLSRMKPGESLDAMGPLGNGFDLARPGRENLLVAGGMGIAPMAFMVRRLKQLRLKNELFYGCRSHSELIKPLPKTCRLFSNDGSCGRKGLVTSLLAERLGSCQDPVVYACGPWPMLKATAKICHRLNIPCQVSLESFMACGVGACQGCVVKNSHGSYISVCDKGPVFDSRLIDWDQECTV